MNASWHFCGVSGNKLVSHTLGWVRRLVAALLLALSAPQVCAEGFSTVSLPPTGTQPVSKLIQEWRTLMAGMAGSTEMTKIQQANAFFNRRIRFEEDAETWGQSDYWATPMETLTQGRGDCEDFAIAKYFTLLEVGVPASRLRLVYAKISLDGFAGSVARAHMILAYYPLPDSTPLVLDNLSNEIVTASSRPDLTPVFSFNTEGLWIGTGNQASRSSYSRWQNLILRAHHEGFLQSRSTPMLRAGL